MCEHGPVSPLQELFHVKDHKIMSLNCIRMSWSDIFGAITSCCAQLLVIISQYALDDDFSQPMASSLTMQVIFYSYLGVLN